jgi:hypothetical protein
LISDSYYKYCSFDTENSILYHDVNEENFGTKESFVMSMSHFMSLLDEFRPKNLIIKVYKKPDYFELELQNFLQTTLYKLVKDLHIEKVAFYMFHKNYVDELKKHEDNTILSARFFMDLDDAIQWVKTKD